MLEYVYGRNFGDSKLAAVVRSTAATAASSHAAEALTNQPIRKNVDWV
jgi:hypothetical protein